ncbi:MAG: OmpA family protein [Myxococcales bacterium]|nr:OmpA family protein [Myxococcales bacterium]MCB9642658.1 OmpA family protein [Myxococcales bacterium]
MAPLLGCFDSLAQEPSGSDAPPIARFAPKVTSYRARSKKNQPQAQVPFAPLDQSAPVTKRLASKTKLPKTQKQLGEKVERYFAKSRQLRTIIETDKPIYQPGQTIWSRAIFLQQKQNQPLPKRGAALFQLLDPRGRVHQKKRVEVIDGHAAMDFSLAKGLVGGEYKLKVQHLLLPDLIATHKLTVSVYQAPRIKKKLDFLRKAYGAGEEVQAFFSIKRATGEPLRNHPLRLIAQLDGKDYKRWRAQTNEKGEVILSLRLPTPLQTDDGLLNVLIEDAGVTESIARPLPLAVKHLKVGFFPEGGTAALGLTNRIYFTARRKIDNKPFDFSGEIRDSKERIVAQVRSYHDGMGRFLYKPKKDQSYKLYITQPKGIDTPFELPQARPLGFSFQAHDDTASAHKDLRLTVHSQRTQTITLLAIQHETLLAQQSYKVRKGTRQIRLPLKHQWRGVLRLTAFAQNGVPLAERLIFRRHGKGLKISIKTNKKSYQLRETVTAKIKVTTPSGKPVPNALLGASVVDDTVLNFADDHEPHFLSQRFLSTQLTGKIHKPNFYFHPKKKKAPYAIDLVMGTHGWRAFSWQQVEQQPPFPVAKPLDSLYIPQVYPESVPMPNRWMRRGGGGRPGRARRPMMVPPPMPQVARAQPQPKPVVAVQAPPPEQPQKRQPVVAAPPANHKNANLGPVAPAPKAKRRARRFEAKKDIAAKEAPRRLGLVRVRNQRIYIYQKIHFKEKKTDITEQQMPILRQMARVLQNHPNLRVCVAGHTSNFELPKASRETHNELSIQRARSVRSALEKLGIDKARLMLGSYGPERPIYASYQKNYARYNQRVGFTIQPNACPTSYPNYGFHQQRIFPTKFYASSKQATKRTDFRETLYWNPKFKTDPSGEATLRFGLNDNATSFRIRVSGLGGAYVGRKEHVFSAEKPFFLVVKAPLEVSADDALALPLTLHNRTSKKLRVRVSSTFSKGIKLLEDPTPSTITLGARQSKTFFYPLRVVARYGTASMEFSAKGSGIEDSFTHSFKIEPRGFPRLIAGGGMASNVKEETINFDLPEDIRSASPKINLSFTVSTLSQLTNSLAAMLREPYGCFEQTSSTNYPNVMIVNFLKQQGIQAPQIMRRAQGLLNRGYKRLVQFETQQKGFEWFGRSPGHEALTAYGLMQFSDMRAIFPELDEKMVQRTKSWLKAKRDGKGGYIRSSRALDTFGRAPSDITDAYITFARAEANDTKLGTELSHVRKLTKQKVGRNDPYLLALAAASFFKVRGKTNPTAQKLLQRLLASQKADGSFQGTRTSITSSYGYNLQVETTSLAILAMLQASPLPDESLQRAIQWIMKNQRYGGYGATQATILALRALIAYQSTYPSKPGEGRITVWLNDQMIEEKSFDAKQLTAVKFANFEKSLRPGKNTLKIRLKSTRKLPYALNLRYYTFQPLSSESVPLKLTAQLNKQRARMGETVRMTATLKNTSKRGLPMTLARLAFPGSLQPQLWQLRALKEKKLVDYYETRPREIILYWRSLAPRFKTTIKLDLEARITGNYSAAPSRTYLYYTNDQVYWTKPLSTSIIP